MSTLYILGEAFSTIKISYPRAALARQFYKKRYIQGHIPSIFCIALRAYPLQLVRQERRTSLQGRCKCFLRDSLSSTVRFFLLIRFSNWSSVRVFCTSRMPNMAHLLVKGRLRIRGLYDFISTKK